MVSFSRKNPGTVETGIGSSIHQVAGLEDFQDFVEGVAQL
jgi:hypothetical protein